MPGKMLIQKWFGEIWLVWYFLFCRSRRVACLLSGRGGGWSAFEQVEKFFVGEPRLADDAADDVLGQIRPCVIGDGDPSGLLGVLELDVGAGSGVDIKTRALKRTVNLSGLDVRKLWGQALDGDF